ncbi:dihydrofolate reductase [Anaerococcus nagyae]|uniref:dihydrofolate reductase n=1 Tax=Anaerococcus nagyae TaxID=1755241 RepID=A0A3E2TL30_9FIRM|nr:dihydrofolate reductase [Anaerococcus nagyae]RGB78127.1 dihydrofolate reductase [Anaerococcus nagyae]
MKIILAVDENWGIGKGNEMLFHLSTDLKHFKEETIHNIVIMGRNTYESMGGGLTDRKNIVLSRNTDYKLDDAKVFNDYKEVLSFVENSPKEAYVIGGSQIVDIFLPFCNEAIITKIYASRDADTYLHNFDKDNNFEIINKSGTNKENGIKFEYITYRRK